MISVKFSVHFDDFLIGAENICEISHRFVESAGNGFNPLINNALIKAGQVDALSDIRNI